MDLDNLEINQGLFKFEKDYTYFVFGYTGRGHGNTLERWRTLSISRCS